MAARTSFGKRERERAKKAKAEAKRERRQDNTEVEADPLAVPAGDLSAAQILDLLDKVQAEFDREAIEFEEYEERKMDLLSQLPLD
jgi:hypothetical protein